MTFVRNFTLFLGLGLMLPPFSAVSAQDDDESYTVERVAPSSMAVTESSSSPLDMLQWNKVSCDGPFIGEMPEVCRKQESPEGEENFMEVHDGVASRFDAESKEKIRDLESKAMGYYSELRKMESAIKNSSYPNTTPFTLSVQNLRSALLTLDRVKNMDEVAVGLSLDRMSSALNELCKNEDENIVRACKNAPDGEVDRYFIGTLNFIEGAPEPVVEVNPEIIPDDEEAVDSEESEGGVAAVRSACAAAFGGNDGSQLLTSHLSSGKCAKELAANSEVAEQIGVQGIIEALQRWRSVARGKRRNLLMLEGIGIERLYQIGIVVHPGKNQADL